MKFAICNEIFQGWKFADACALAAQVGYDAIEIAPFTFRPSVTDLSAADRTAIRETAARAGLEVAGLHWVLVQTEGLHLTSPDPEVRARTAKYFVELVDCCADVGGRVVVVGSPKQRNLAEGVTPAEGWRWAAECFRDAGRRAEERGVVLCLEPLAPAETNFVNTAAEALRHVREFGSSAFKIILDVKAMCSEATPIPEIIRAAWPDFAHFHANDRNLKGPGFGDVDFHPIAAALRDVGYHGYVSVEVFNFEEGPEAIATRSLEYLRHVFVPGSSEA
ncbi:MAG: sugar phosphate isomerase/epimerase [Verrucomicrobiales bacterium]|nr:sugar phosphate isomerase/epimerase [Verrucomicrobiales bacterium]